MLLINDMNSLSNYFNDHDLNFRTIIVNNKMEEFLKAEAAANPPA